MGFPFGGDNEAAECQNAKWQHLTTKARTGNTKGFGQEASLADDSCSWGTLRWKGIRHPSKILPDFITEKTISSIQDLLEVDIESWPLAVSE